MTTKYSEKYKFVMGRKDKGIEEVLLDQCEKGAVIDEVILRSA